MQGRIFLKSIIVFHFSHMNNQRYMAPLGAYLMLSSFILAITLVFSFVCLPMGSDKVKLRKSLFCWLAVDLGIISFTLFFYCHFQIFNDKVSLGCSLMRSHEIFKFRYTLLHTLFLGSDPIISRP